MAYTFSDNKLSFIHQLFTHHLIDSLSFSIIPHDNLEGNIFLGGIPNDNSNTKYHGIVNIEQKPYWGF